ncbi:MAG TPA: hypothetical protein VM012_10335 [Flavitalea sp.]|nr:hypothetical protein [Flavitalea sp.]
MQDKLTFLKNDFIFLLKHLAPDARGKWGVMNGQQMVEHFTESVKIANGKHQLPVMNEGEKLQQYRTFLMSEAPFKENTRNALLGETPAPTKHSTMQNAIADLQAELNDFYLLFEKNPDSTTTNPFFGDLTFEQNVKLLHKHAQHHLKQFGLLK